MHIWHAIEDGAARFGERRMVSDTYGRSLTFHQFRERAESVATGLHKLGITSDARVSWQLPTGLEAAVLMAALARIGAVQNPLIMSLREAELRTVRAQFSPDFVFTPNSWREFDQGRLRSASRRARRCHPPPRRRTGP